MALLLASVKMKVPARCNRRECQGRKTLTVHTNRRDAADLIVNATLCKKCKEGYYYIDWYRFDNGKKDNAPNCKNPNCRYMPRRKNGSLMTFHRISAEGCADNVNYRKQIYERGHVKNSPHPKNSDIYEIPF